MKIALSKASGAPRYKFYFDWLEAADSENEYVDLHLEENRASALEILAECSGLILTGGADVEPSRYGMAEELPRCGVDSERDAFEFALIEKAREMKMPILGVCRGCQALNVAFGGTLVVDIPSDVAEPLLHGTKTGDARHEVELEPGSILAKIVGEFEGEINSAHHQSVGLTGEETMVVARSSDGVAEAIEWKEPLGRQFMLGVQWHPERMNFDSPFSLRLAKHFLFEAESYSILTPK